MTELAADRWTTRTNTTTTPTAPNNTANAKGWDLLYSFKETYRVPDVSPRSIHLASQRILHDSHYASRYVYYAHG